MILTMAATKAMQLGHRLAMSANRAYEAQYADNLAAMRQDVEALGGDPALLPDSADAFRADPFAAFYTLLEVLARARGRLGADGFALPFFVLNYMLYRAVSRSALGLGFDDELNWMAEALEDLNIEAQAAPIKELIHAETLWIQSIPGEDGDVNVRMADVVNAWARINNRIMALWRESERRYWQDLPAIGMGYVPLYSCFISYSFADEAFCQKLYDRLRLAGVQVWFASHDMKAGQKIRAQVTKAIGNHDKLLLVLSDASLKSNWVDHELYTAFHRETEEKHQVLFPIRLVPHESLRKWQAFDADSGRDLAREIREYFIPDFSNWQDDAAFDAAVDQLLASLRKSDEAPRVLSRTG